MIASVRGEVLDVALDHAVVEAGGVGYKVMHPGHPGHPVRHGTEAQFGHRDDRAGLPDPLRLRRRRRRDLFGTLLRGVGVGPRSRWPPSPCTTPRRCGRPRPTAMSPPLTRVPGIGKRGAERMVLELRTRSAPPRPLVGQAWPAATGSAACGRSLVGLGFAQKQAGDAYERCSPAAGRQHLPPCCGPP